MKPIHIYLFLAGTVVATAFSLVFIFPEYRPYLVEEDSLIENASALFFLLTFLWGLRLGHRHTQLRFMLWVVSGIGLLGFLDEISFGERLLSLSMPWINGVKIDAAHDLFGLACVTAKQLVLHQTEWLFPLVAGGSIIAIPSMVKHRNVVFHRFCTLIKRPSSTLGLTFIAILSTALIIDLDLIHNYWLFALEELLELNAALALIFWQWQLLNDPIPKP
jgi:hypothetical protein